MRVVDTSIWIEWIAGTPVGSKAAPHFPEPAAWIVPTIVQLELLKWARRAVGEAKAGEILALTQHMEVILLTTSLAEQAARLAADHRLATADAIIYATALENGADLLTCDAHFDGLPSVLYLPKTAN